MAKTNRAMFKKNEEISMSALLKMVMKDKKIPKVENFTISNDLLKITNILLQGPCNTRADVCHSCKRFVVNFMGKKK